MQKANVITYGLEFLSSSRALLPLLYPLPWNSGCLLICTSRAGEYRRAPDQTRRGEISLPLPGSTPATLSCTGSIFFSFLSLLYFLCRNERIVKGYEVRSHLGAPTLPDAFLSFRIHVLRLHRRNVCLALRNSKSEQLRELGLVK